MIDWLAIGLGGAAAGGCLHFGAAAVLAPRCLRRREPAPSDGAGRDFSVLKPLHGDEPGLFDNLLSLVDQSVDARPRIVCGVTDPDDPAVDAVRRLRSERPDADITLIVQPRRPVSNPKMSNVLNLAPEAGDDIVVLADSDIRVPPDYLAGLAADLDRAEAVTCLYTGQPTGGAISRMSALGIDAWFLPGVVVGLALGLARPCFGSTIAMRRDMLDRIGGFAAFANVLADDNAMGEAVRAAGGRVALGPLVRHLCSETGPVELWQHELRWARTLRQIDPGGYAGSAVTHPLPLALLAWLAGGGGWSLALAALALAAQAGFLIRLRLLTDQRPEAADLLLLPLRSLLSFAIYLAAYGGSGVGWRGQDYRLDANGTLTPEGDRQR